MRRIIKVESDITWANFKKRFARFFPISNKAEHEKKLKEEYFRLTGRKVR
ncbi:MAG: hypothetical protein DIU61_008770 [Bacteroidota bacterium]